MAIFPDSTTIKPLLDYDATPIENVRRTPSESGLQRIRDVWGREKFQATMEFDLSPTDAATMIAFRSANRAATFTFYDFDPSRPFSNETIGTGDGATLTFTIPAKETTSQIVQVADGLGGWTTKTAGVHYNITAGSGALGEDRVVFTGGNAPANGRDVRISYTGRHRYTCIFTAYGERVISSTGRKAFSIRVEESS